MITDIRKKRNGTGAIQAVIFDLDGVLLDSEWLFFLEWQRLAEELGGYLPEGVFPELVGTTVEESAELVIRHAEINLDVERICALVSERVAGRLKTELEPIPGSRELVEAIARRSYPLAIASNSSSGYVEDALQGLDLAAYFPVWIGRDQVADGKPAPDVYLRAAGRLGISPERCLAIEDSRVGLRAAASAGMRVVVIPGPRDDPNGFGEAWRIYPSLHELLKHLDAVLA